MLGCVAVELVPFIVHNIHGANSLTPRNESSLPPLQQVHLLSMPSQAWRNYARGRISVERLLKLHGHYANYADRWRAWWSLLLTPVPVFVITLLVDVIPLEPTSRGVAHSHMLWVRTWMCFAFICVTGIIKLRQIVPRLRLPTRVSTVITTATATLGTLSIFALAHIVGYPVPFAIPSGSPVVIVTFVLLVYCLVGSRSVLEQAKPLRVFVFVVTIQFTQTIVYPSFILALSRLDPRQQPYFVMFLPIIKVAYKVLLSNVMTNHQDLRSVLVVLNAEVFHALFISVSMQSIPSGVTTLIITTIDLLFLARSLYRVRRRHNKLAKLMLGSSTPRVEADGRQGVPPLVSSAAFLLQEKVVLDEMLVSSPHREIIYHNAIFPINDKVANPIPLPPALPSQLDLYHQAQLGGLSQSDKVAFVQQTLRLLHETQTLLLNDYIEVIVPVVYASFFATASCLPNHSYYRFSGDGPDGSIARVTTSVLPYAALKLMSFVSLDAIIYYLIGHHAIHQLTFVLQTEASLVQSELVLWLVYVLQTSLDHYGACQLVYNSPRQPVSLSGCSHAGFDLTFGFAWLHA